MTLQFSPQTRRVFHLSLPIFAELLLQLLVGNMDQFMISHFGSAAVADPGLVKEAVERFGPERIAVGLDVKGNSVRTAGWQADSGLDWLDFARRMESLGAATLIFTDIDTDGTLSGPPFERLAALQQAVGCDIIASGGVSSNEDLNKLAGMGLYGAIVGKAYYAGKVDLARAVREVQP